MALFISFDEKPRAFIRIQFLIFGLGLGPIEKGYRIGVFMK